jgi:hypothetical protein
MVEPKKRIWGWGYFLFLAVMAYIGAGMIIYFGRMKWLLDFGLPILDFFGCRILKCGLIMTSERSYVYGK